LLRISTPRSILSRASTPNLTSLADIYWSPFELGPHPEEPALERASRRMK
jgi:hypothetical protein